MPYERYTKRLWNIISMEKAVQLYKTTETTIGDAAAQYHVPPSSLHQRYDFMIMINFYHLQ